MNKHNKQQPKFKKIYPTPKSRHNTTNKKKNIIINYHLKYTEEYFNKILIDYLKDLIIKQHFFKMNNDEKTIKLICLNSFISMVYNVSIPNLIIKENYFCHYNPLYQTIILNKPSLISFLHEFKHHLDKDNTTTINNAEINARGFSHSLYFIVSPKLFKIAIRKRLLIHQKEII